MADTNKNNKGAADQQYKRQRFSVSPESSGKKTTPTTAPVASSAAKLPAMVAPSPFASTKPPTALAASSPVASAKPLLLAPPSPVAMTKPPALVSPNRPVASSTKAPLLAAPSPVAMAKPMAVAKVKPSIAVAKVKKPSIAVAKVKPSIAALVAKHGRDDGGNERAAGAMLETVAQTIYESKATAKAAPDQEEQQQMKRLRYSVSPPPVASTKSLAPEPVMPSPLGSTKATSPVALSPAASTAKAPAPTSVASSTKAPAVPSPVAMAEPITVTKPSTSMAVVNHERDCGGDERTIPTVDTAEDWVSLDVAKKRLHCAVCPSPLKPPIFQCEDGHVVCCACGGDGAPNRRCRACECDGRATTYTRFSYMDGLVGDYRVPCPYKKFGCSTSMAYHEAAEHKASCPHAPCYCLEECAFEGSPTMLLRHLTADGGRHGWPMQSIKYETVYQFVVAAAAEHRRLLVAEEDGRVFLLAVGTGRGVRPVTVVCVTANADARPLYKGVLLVEGPPAADGDIRDESTVAAKVASCAVPGEVDLEQGRLHVHVNPSFLHGESSELHVRLSIIKFP